MRQVKGSNKNVHIGVGDEPGEGGACHEYYLSPAITFADEIAGGFGNIRFQNGPVKENGVNGCHQEDLLAIVIDRLEHFQAGDFKCRENALALTKIQEALRWLQHRTAARVDRGVEGKNIK